MLDEITDDGDSPIEIARAIQAYLRGPLFTYSLELADQAADGNLSDEPLARFLETKRGYCVQFASAMIMLTREAGIPARMAVGFLPGAPDGDDRVVRVSDAHAWPELYFPRLGWVRFEPTPGTRSGVAPEYSQVPTDTGSTSSASPTSSSSTSSPSPSTGPSRDVTDDPTTGATGTSGVGALQLVGRHSTTILVTLLVVLVGAIVPFGAWLSRRRARRTARDDAELVEAEWQSLLLRLQDIGFVAPDGATPRQASRRIGHDAYLTPDENDALGRVVTTLERARYARPGGELERRHRRRPGRVARGALAAPAHRPGAGAAAARGGKADVAPPRPRPALLAAPRLGRPAGGLSGTQPSNGWLPRPPTPADAPRRLHRRNSA